MRILKDQNIIVFVLCVMVFPIGFVSFVCGESFQCKAFSVSIPHGWSPMTPADLASHEKSTKQLNIKNSPQSYPCGFKLEDAESGSTFPYTLISVRNIGRFAEPELEKMEQFDLNKTLKGINDKLTTVDLQYSAGKMVYDRENSIIWAYAEANIAGVAKARIFSGIIPTEKGFIQCVSCCLKEDYYLYEADFREVALSLSPVSNLLYKPKWSVPFLERGDNYIGDVEATSDDLNDEAPSEVFNLEAISDDLDDNNFAGNSNLKWIVPFLESGDSLDSQ